MGTVTYLSDWIFNIFDSFVKIMPVYIRQHHGETMCETISKGAFIMIMDRIALILSIIGGLNWGLVGLFRFDLVAYLFGGQTATVSRVIYTIVGLSAIWCISLLFRQSLVADDGE